MSIFPMFAHQPMNISTSPTNLSMTTSITSALCAHSSIAGPHLLPACSPLLQLAVRQALGACLPNFDQLSIQGQLEISVRSNQNGQPAAPSTTILKFCDGASERGEPACVGASKRKSCNPTKYIYINEPMNQSVSTPASPSTDSGVLDLSLGGSLAGSASMTPIKEHSVPMDDLKILNPQQLLQIYQNQLQSIRFGNSLTATEHPGMKFEGTPSQYYSGNSTPIKPTCRRPRTVGRVGQMRRLNPNRRFPCNQCTEEFPSLQTLEEHTMTLHGSYRCHICEAQFTQRSNLQRHALKHVGFKPFECRVCNKSYYRKDHLMRHMEMGHPGYSPREYITVHLTSSESLDFLNRSGLGQVRMKSEGKVEESNQNSTMEVDVELPNAPSPGEHNQSSQPHSLSTDVSTEDPPIGSENNDASCSLLDPTL